jgi:hypothetical protein
VISSSEVEVLDASHSAEVLETQGDISDISGIVSKEVTMGIVVEIGIMLLWMKDAEQMVVGLSRCYISQRSDNSMGQDNVKQACTSSDERKFMTMLGSDWV